MSKDRTVTISKDEIVTTINQTLSEYLKSKEFVFKDAEDLIVHVLQILVNLEKKGHSKPIPLNRNDD